MKIDTDSIQKYIDKINDVGKDVAKKQFDEIMSNASAQAKLYVKQTDAAALSTEAFAASQTRLAKISNTVIGGLKGIGAGLLSMGVSLVLSAAINAVSKAIYNAVTAEKRYREAAIEAGSALDEQTSSENEAYDARKQLIDIQNELIEKFGDEAIGIDLVNGSDKTIPLCGRYKYKQKHSPSPEPLGFGDGLRLWKDKKENSREIMHGTQRAADRS